MPLIVEDGTGLENADSYISLVDARSLAVNYGYSLPADDIDAEVALRQGADYVDLSEPSFTGTRLNDVQALAWPRSNAYKCIGNTYIVLASDSVPSDVKRAQVVAAAGYGAGGNPRGNINGKTVIQETVGPLTVRYSDNSGDSATYTITAANDLLRPYTCGSSNGLTQRTVRG
jgi:hypothetical protein